MKPEFIAAATLSAAFALPGLAAAEADKTDKAGASPAKLHSHVEERTGVPQKRAAAPPAKPDPTKNRALHLHPRDAR